MQTFRVLAIVLGILTAVSVRAETPENLPPSSKIPYSSLTPDEREILGRGEIGTGAYVGGGIAGTLLGFGIGNAIQGRYMPNGLIFTLGEVGSLALFEWGFADCFEQSLDAAFGTATTVRCHDGAVVVGVLAFTGLRIWEMIDLWASPPSHNDRYRDLKRRVDGAPSASWGILPALVADDRGTRRVDGAALGLQIRF